MDKDFEKTNIGVDGNAQTEYISETESTALRNEQRAAEKIERLNGVFDRLIVPIIIFTILLIVCTGLIPKWAASCAQKEAIGEEIILSQEYSFYSDREHLLDFIADNTALFEEHGFVLLEDETSGYIAYRKLDSGTEIMNNLIDSNGNRYCAVFGTRGDADITIMIYSRSLFLVVVERGEEQYTAIFGSDSFAADPSDSDICAVLGVVDSQQLESLMDEYKACMGELLESMK